MTVLVALLTALLLLLSGYTGYAGLGLAVAIAGRHQPALAASEPPAPASHATSSLAARPRWLIASFCASPSSAIVLPGGPSSGSKAGS